MNEIRDLRYRAISTKRHHSSYTNAERSLRRLQTKTNQLPDVKIVIAKPSIQDKLRTLLPTDLVEPLPSRTRLRAVSHIVRLLSVLRFLLLSFES